MTREDRIRQASYDWTGEYSNNEFHWGVDWADKHPKEGLWDKEKVIEWLNENLVFDDSEQIIEDLIDAMEE